ncbi:MAG: ubiquitin-conjugating enzyme E2 [Candidatus Sericytochromatia bacterium]|nr:ubiquitin-conjugating enzyme E2 [Candidatus Sericytochromatia bacterium]
MEARRRRLDADARALAAVAKTLPTVVEVLQSQGTPPDRHLIRLTMPAIEKLDGETPVRREQHRIEIRLTSAYPLEAPIVRALSPVFHPHVFANGTFCLGSRWMVGETLGDLVMRLIDILRCDPQLFDFDSAANGEAADWYEAHPDLFPLADRPGPAEATEVAKPRLEWRDV